MTRFVSLVIILLLAGCNVAADVKNPPPCPDCGVSSDLPPLDRCTSPACLPSAKAGDTVTLLADARGPLVVPPGVTLEGAAGLNIVVSTDGPGAAVIANTDAETGRPTAVRDLTLVPKRGVGLLVLGNGEFEGGGLTVTVSAGVGVAAEGPKRFTLTNSRVRGERALGVLRGERFPVAGVVRPILGLALSKIGNVQLENVDVEHFIGFGALLLQCGAVWRGGRVTEQVGVGLYVHGGTVALENVQVERNAASTSLLPSLSCFGVIAAGGASLQSRKLRVTQNEGVGLVQAEGSAIHDELLVADNGGLGVEVQGGGRLTARKTTIARNVGVGLLARGASWVVAQDSTVSDTQALPFGRAAKRLGDGLQLVLPLDKLRLERVALTNNARAACVLHGADPGPRGALITVSQVKMSGGTYGLVTQGGMTVWPSWDYQGASASVEYEAVLPPALVLAEGVAAPTPGVLSGSLIGNDQGQISPTGGVTIQVNPQGFDPGRGP